MPRNKCLYFAFILLMTSFIARSAFSASLDPRILVSEKLVYLAYEKLNQKESKCALNLALRACFLNRNSCFNVGNIKSITMETDYE